MGQRGIRNLYNSGVDLYWEQFYFINQRNYNWLWQVTLLKLFCKYLFVWVARATNFLTNFIAGPAVSFFTLRYYQKLYKWRLVRMRFMLMWVLRIVVLRYSYWLLVVIEYFGGTRARARTFKAFKKIRKIKYM